jgi:hypothetical protein
MKKLVFLAIALLTMCIANAQVSEDIQKSQERALKLKALCDSYKASGNASIDGYGDDVKAAAIFAIANSEQLESMYKRQIGTTEDGVTDVTVNKPTLEEWATLATTVAGEGAMINSAVEKAKAAGEEAKNIAQSASSEKNPMKAAKAAKSAKAATAVIEFGNVATPILAEESAAQVKAINEIISTLKSGGNL